MEVITLNIERLLREDTLEKKRTGRGIFSAKGKRGYVGKMIFPTDLMSRKDKYNHRKAGKVVSFNMYETVIEFENFTDMQEEEQKRLLTEYRKRFPNKTVMDAWGIDHNKYYRIINDLGIKKEPRKSRKEDKTEDKTEEINYNEALGEKNMSNQLIEVKNKIFERETEIPKELIEAKASGLSLSFNGEYSAEDIIKKLEKVGIILSDEPNKFKVEINIKEIM